ncbi:Angiopoietin-related protein 1,Ficolin-1-A,Ryncolin-1,Fibrinogen C domain-containing protein 1,Tenascin-N,Angiopoietin-related protein 7,Angiopoietin-related protein 6,Ficolin-3,Fibrinogen C domain-containing protein 1-B,Fibroleukin,Fibrinogen-like protein 1,Ficolin-1,Ficolin-1-B,Angiopoietin-4,Tenascin-R,Ryncolin-2,Techylectin-5B,Fibrinogen C domain-containing protein 1-A,Microfibril-associated glycoprotein 4,Fibrinogen-like protein A,Ryncolin-3,Fibrinogen gamma chain,Angiopoietin-2,Tenascin-X,Ficolin-2,F|uniref:Fibrinogen C-terminal domain-containing protein n=1 Tax=Mytilus edulis TaxID=6550 RepID=A0A8S3R4L2_MYTED|nr:Angiopoietin-related protein 1,Ficolin-1-A,Ryncolin-1,Fibrinogen C domain-containing protein 1,Tenascin-N,Angiopoietin-related protein 7,Angiopoietin-related protein 6,Ficolin-3,Fibrinogen C domain-containing protein 1-B,Fibroleukin,Fibrinogen-like protein 1,Ficolin-1,Ficolin-1-B,Angiopoietin-4,Tenascin-R,Ryncolin-2,Techylectin-5B,Fibrinogen C domain-containing protein 1-A,Microfibril-associated glycoprotein 4,Fibrinogen-like protein A,Ryncolin-3,Fibrinogen gamma chain,Angiopoietin-2,Tenascin-X,
MTEQNSAHSKELEDIRRILQETANVCRNELYKPGHSKDDHFKHRPRDCSDIDIKQESGVYKIYPESSADGLNVYCDMTTESVNGGWTVFQRRISGKVDFYRDWEAYKEGFGSLQNEFWLGNDRLHILTSHGKYQLLITMEDFAENNRYALYDTFKVGDEKSKYVLTINSYMGSAGDSFAKNNGQKFSTKDQDNDIYDGNCATQFKGAWWYTKCHAANLNGLYLSGNHSTFADGINWATWMKYYYSLKTTAMMIRRLK